MSATLPALPHARAVSAVSIMSTASIMSAARASASPAHAGARGADAPATPDADEARRAAERELARPEYRDESLLGRLWRWLSEHLNLRGVVPAGPDWLSILIVVVIPPEHNGVDEVIDGTTVLFRRASGAALAVDKTADTTHF